MALSKKQVKQLRALANGINPMLWIGKSGVTEATLAQAAETLDAHELIKCVVQDGSPVDAREAGEELAGRLGADLVQVIGHRFVLYRHSSKDGVKQIQLIRQ
ncbi:ribosome assembly RNA-binding protein YhbY [Bifidobacterium aemilianum]|uniref:Ribosome assembly RNA-binding protein YhbY n=1 Tax=Bifidobacterium aemilianum TaxID=2493120 RepID=A0A366KBD2_9BIFI|nr:YhbY family RNA-binding protein [Bifidobacterium aemilianum]RBP98677.1 ribosome assembly RNA-binding protein YhbY [Bifidobacterium aemilianum]